MLVACLGRGQYAQAQTQHVTIYIFAGAFNLCNTILLNIPVFITFQRVAKNNKFIAD
jgi:hypothetical protein